MEIYLYVEMVANRYYLIIVGNKKQVDVVPFPSAIRIID